MTASRHWVFAIGMAFLAAACATPRRRITVTCSPRQGFVQRKADTPERIAALKSLPPHQFVMRNSNGSVK